MNVRTFANRVHRLWRQQGARRTARFLSSRILRHRRCLVFEAGLTCARPCPQWLAGEGLQVIGPENIDSEVTPDLHSFLGHEALENLEGVRQGNRLFVVSNGSEFLHCGYILLHSRQTKIIGEPNNPPLIACCQTLDKAQGKGIYRRALQAELCYLHQQGYTRAVIETDPQNIASRKGIEAAGFRFCREARVWILLNWFVCLRALEPSGPKWRTFFI